MRMPVGAKRKYQRRLKIPHPKSDQREALLVGPFAPLPSQPRNRLVAAIWKAAKGWSMWKAAPVSARRPVNSFTVEFDREGDRGQIDEIAAYAGQAQTELPLTTLTLHQARWNKDDPKTAEATLRDAIENLCYNYLSETHGGWVCQKLRVKEFLHLRRE